MVTLITDVDGTLTGDSDSLSELNALLSDKNRFFTVYATGRSYGEFQNALESGLIEYPDAAILNTGADIYIRNNGAYGIDERWHSKISDNKWNTEIINSEILRIPGVTSQHHEHNYKMCYFIEPAKAEIIKKEAEERLERQGIPCRIILSHNHFMDIIPKGCDKGLAARYMVKKFNIDPEGVIVAGDSENDIDLFLNFNKGIVVANARQPLVSGLEGRGLYMAKRPFAAGVLEGLRHYLNKTNAKGKTPNKTEGK